MPGFVSGYTNSISDRRSKYVAQNLGCFLHFNMATFHNTELDSANSNINDFNPTALNVGQWLDNVVAMKAAYAVLTVKHWDGFCLWTTATTTRNITQCSPWYGASGIDIAGTFVSGCRSRGIAPMFYFSNYDATYTANNSGATQAQARDFQNAQLKELLTNYVRCRLSGPTAPNGNMATPIRGGMRTTISIRCAPISLSVCW